MFTASSCVVNWVHTIHLKRFSTNIYYCIAGNFQGSKLSQISWFCGYLRKFSSQNLEMWHSSNPQKFSPRKSYFSQICNSFLPQKFPAYTVFPAISERNPLYGIIIHLSQRQHLIKGVLDNKYMSLTALLWDIVLENFITILNWY